MKKTRAKRKLMPKALLDIVLERKTLGVPIARIIKDLKLDMSRTSLGSLITIYSQVTLPPFSEYDTINNSLFPPWLNDSELIVQEQPNNWYYIGHFPWGQWKND